MEASTMLQEVVVVVLDEPQLAPEKLPYLRLLDERVQPLLQVTLWLNRPLLDP
jgi:hypothetical protein